MKSLTLKCPFTWKERHVTIHDRVWYIPLNCENYHEFKFDGWSNPDVFLNNNPIKIEYCSGNGEWIAARARQEANVNWVAVDLNFDRVKKIWKKIKQLPLNNLMIVCGDGRTLTEYYVPEASVQEVYINFPDPWPKQRHAKHRIVEEEFVKNVHRILKPGGIFTIATDDQDYSTLTINILNKCEGFESCHPAPYYTHELPNYGSSYFEDLWRRKGKVIYYHQFCKK